MSEDFLIHSKVEDFIKVPKFHAVLTGCYPRPKNAKWNWLYNLYSLIFTHISSYLFLASLTIDIFMSLGNTNIVADASYYLLSQVSYCFKLVVFTLRRDKFKKILEYLEDDVFNSYLPEQQVHFKNWSNFTYIFSKYFFLICWGVFFVYGMFPYLDSESILPHRGWFPFDVYNNMWNRAWAFVFQMFTFAVAIAANGCMDTFTVILMNIGCAQLVILKDTLENAVKRAEKLTATKLESEMKDVDMSKQLGDNYCEMLSKEADEIVYETIIKSINHHEAIMKLLSEIEDMFTPAMFAQLLATSISLCVTGFELILLSTNTFKFYSIMSYLSSITCEILLYCWSGHLVMEQSSGIGESCYNMEWYKCSTKVRRAITIMMERTKKPIHIVAGKFFIMSITMFTTLIRTSYSYFAVLRRIYVPNEK